MERFSGAVKVADWVEITDTKSAKAWLKTQEHQTQVWFATRCALRALPSLGNWQDVTSSGIAFQICRAMLISTAAATCLTTEIKSLEAAAARSATANVIAATPIVAAAAYSAARSATATVSAPTVTFTDVTVNAAAAAARSAAAATRSATAVWRATTAEANAPKTWGKLWPDNAAQPDALKDSWDALKRQWQADGPHWSFWIEWYEAVLKGEWTNWDLILKIATEVTEDQWDAGPAVVAARIAEIEDEQNRERGAVEPEPVDRGNVVSLFDRSPIVQASMASLSKAVSLRVDAFTRMHRPNEAIPFFDALTRLPETAGRIAKILDEGPSAPNADASLALEIGRLRAEVEQLKAALKSAQAELETLRKKPWYRSASILLPVTVVSSITTGLWVLSGDDKLLEHRWNKLAKDLEFLSLKVWPEPEDRINEPLRFELPDAEKT